MNRSENFLARWSRLKREGEPMPVPAATPPQPLPDPASLGFDDDFSQFLGAEVAEGIKRVALKKLFHSAQFNVMDGLDVYIDDYSLPDPLDEGMLRALNQARGLVFDVEAVTTEQAVPLPPLQGEGWGGDGVTVAASIEPGPPSTATRTRQSPHPPPNLPLERGGDNPSSIVRSTAGSADGH